MTIAVLVGGPLDGESVDVAEGIRLVFPLVTAEFQARRTAWAAQHLVAWTFETIDGIPEHPSTPPPPSYPEAVYDWVRQDDGTVLGVYRDI